MTEQFKGDPAVLARYDQARAEANRLLDSLIRIWHAGDDANLAEPVRISVFTSALWETIARDRAVEILAAAVIRLAQRE